MTDFNHKAILLLKFTAGELPDLEEFDCGDNEANDFYKNKAFWEQQRGLSTTTLLYYNGILAACISLWCDAIPLNKEAEGNAEPTHSVPAIKLRYAVDVKFKDYDLDSFIIDFAKNVAFEMWTSKVGVRYLTLDTDASREEFFASKGFVRNRSDSEGIISMRLDVLG